MHYDPTIAAALNLGGAAHGNHSRSGSPDHPPASFGFGGGNASGHHSAQPSPPPVPRSPFMDHHGEAVNGGGIGRALLSQLSFPKLAAAATGGSGPLDVSTPLPFSKSLGHSGISAGSYGDPAPHAAENVFSVGGSTLRGAPPSAIYDISRIDSTAGSSAHGLYGNGSVHGGSALCAPLGSSHRSSPDSPDGATGGSGGTGGGVHIKISNTGPRLAASRRSVRGGGNSSFDGSLRVNTGDDLRTGSWPAIAAPTEGVKSEDVLRLPPIKHQVGIWFSPGVKHLALAHQSIYASVAEISDGKLWSESARCFCTALATQSHKRQQQRLCDHSKYSTALLVTDADNICTSYRRCRWTSRVSPASAVAAPPLPPPQRLPSTCRPHPLPAPLPASSRCPLSRCRQQHPAVAAAAAA